MVTFVNEQDREFFRQLVLNFKDRVVTDVLFFDNAPIVFSINFVYNKTYHLFKTAYHDQYGYFLPGKLLLYYKFPHLQQEGFQVFDFSRGTSTFKKEFTPLSYKQYNLYYAQNVFVRYWWGVAGATNSLKAKLFQNETFHKIYLFLKKMLARLKGKPGSLGFEIKGMG